MNLVLVEWIDSRRGEGWTLVEELRKDRKPTICKSVGWVIGEDKVSLTLSGNLGEDPEQCCGDMTIPTKCIIRMTNLKQAATDQNRTPFPR